MVEIFSAYPAAAAGWVEMAEMAWETQPAAKAENEYSRFLSESLSCQPAQPRSWDGLSLGSQLMSF